MVIKRYYITAFNSLFYAKTAGTTLGEKSFELVKRLAAVSTVHEMAKKSFKFLFLRIVQIQ